MPPSGRPDASTTASADNERPSFSATRTGAPGTNPTTSAVSIRTSATARPAWNDDLVDVVPLATAAIRAAGREPASVASEHVAKAVGVDARDHTDDRGSGGPLVEKLGSVARPIDARDQQGSIPRSWVPAVKPADTQPGEPARLQNGITGIFAMSETDPTFGSVAG